MGWEAHVTRRRHIAGVTAAISAVTLTVPAAAAEWPIGREREVDEGVYMLVVALQDGWRIWRIETRSGVSCNAVKSARGRPHPEPVGVGSAMYGGTPFVIMSPRDGGWRYEWRTTHPYRTRLKYRRPGDRFWNEDSFDANEIGEGEIELVLTSWEYPEILVGFAEERAMFDLTGVEWAQTQVTSCHSAQPKKLASMQIWCCIK